MTAERIKPIEAVPANCHDGKVIRERIKRNRLNGRISIAIVDKAWDKVKVKPLSSGKSIHNTTFLPDTFGFAKVLDKPKQDGVWICK